MATRFEMIVAQLRARMIVRMSKPGRRPGAGLARSGQVRFGQVRSGQLRSDQVNVKVLIRVDSRCRAVGARRKWVGPPSRVQLEAAGDGPFF